MPSTRYWVGCSGWFYRGWRGLFYPADFPMHRWFEYYQSHFSIVEMNSTFYRFPKAATTRAWVRQARPDFAFVTKVHRSISHFHQYDRWPAFYEAMGPLGDRLKGILIQLPPSVRMDEDFWRRLLVPLSQSFFHFVEFRHVTWFQALGRIIKDLPLHVGIVSVSAPASTHLPEELVVTHETAYVRFHGRTAWYRYDYSDAELRAWADRLRAARLKQGFAFFNNDVGGSAPRNALRLMDLLTGASVPGAGFQGIANCGSEWRRQA
ncbi:MAG: DUF72 domain-containing protein [Acidobacteria bacterium]|nr:DUF72 domain-containing protein [Acidobacteriota bacterium]MDW7984107.1 DUF72 domain-containing protein [Acidobacteriota bacterium]